MNSSSCLSDSFAGFYFYVGEVSTSTLKIICHQAPFHCLLAPGVSPVWQNSYVFSVPAPMKLSTGGESQDEQTDAIINL